MTKKEIESANSEAIENSGIPPICTNLIKNIYKHRIIC